MQKVLKLFGFGENICQWIQAFYSNINASVIVNGQASRKFSIGRGCRQGDPICPYLFILCAELLACKIRETDKIKGIKVNQTECKISQFADDTTLCWRVIRILTKNFSTHWTSLKRSQD